MRSVLIVVDMLNDFIYGTLRTPEAAAIVPSARKAIETFRGTHNDVIYVSDSHVGSDVEMKLWGEHAMKGTWGSRIIDDLKPAEGEVVIEKHFYSGFRETGLNESLSSREINNIFLLGLDADICVRHTTADAFYIGFQTYIVRDAVAARIQKDWENYFTVVYGSKIINADQIGDELERLGKL